MGSSATFGGWTVTLGWSELDSGAVTVNIDAATDLDGVERIVVHMNDEPLYDERRRPGTSPVKASPETREVPPTEGGRVGDTITIVGKLATWPERNDKDAIYIESAPFLGEVILTGCSITVTRPVTPLPDEPGSVGSATVLGIEGVRIARPAAMPARSVGRWIVLTKELEVGSHVVHDEDVSDYRPLLEGQEGD